MASYEITSYICRQLNEYKSGAVALIFLYDSSKVQRGILEFYPDGTDIAEASEDILNGRIFLRLPISRFTSFVDILRNETPIYLSYFSPGNAFIQTLHEPIGEEET